MPVALRHTVIIVSSLVAAMLICAVVYLGSIALSVGLGSAVSIPFMTSTQVGEGRDLATSSFIFPGAFLWIFGTAAGLYALTLGLTRRGTRSHAAA